MLAFAPGSKDAIALAQSRALLATKIVRDGIPSFADAADPGEGYWSGQSSALELKVFLYA